MAELDLNETLAGLNKEADEQAAKDVELDKAKPPKSKSNKSSKKPVAKYDPSKFIAGKRKNWMITLTPEVLIQYAKEEAKKRKMSLKEFVYDSLRKNGCDKIPPYKEIHGSNAPKKITG